MTVAMRRSMTLEQFLAWEEGQELRYEFNGLEPVAMTGGTLRHGAICTALRGLLFSRLLGKPCRVWGPTEKIEVQGRIRYPDAFVSCTPGRPDSTIVPEPVVIFEVLSPNTSRIDRIEKLQEYQATTSVRRYVILEQDSIGATVFSRVGNSWPGRALTAGDTLDMPEIGVELLLDDIYAGTQLDEPAPQQSESG